MNFSNSVKDIFILHKNSNFSTKGKINLVLSPELYWCKSFSIPISNPSEIRLILPTYFDDYIEDTQSCSYYFIQLDEAKMYLCFAYKQVEIIKAIEESGLKLSQINKLYFAQNEFKEFEIMKKNPSIAIAVADVDVDTNTDGVSSETEQNTDKKKDELQTINDDLDKGTNEGTNKQTNKENDNNTELKGIDEENNKKSDKHKKTKVDSSSKKTYSLPGIENVFKVSGKFFAYQGSYLVQIPKAVCANLEAKDIDIRMISLSNHSFSITYDSKYISLFALFVLYFVLFFASVLNYFKAYEFFALNSDVPRQMNVLKQQSKTPKTFLETKSVIQKYENNAKQYKKVREMLSYVINFNQSFNGSLKSISLKHNSVICKFDKGRLSAIKNYFSQKYKITISRSAQNTIALKFDI